MIDKKKKGRIVLLFVIGGIILAALMAGWIRISNMRLFAEHQDAQASLQPRELTDVAEFQHLRSEFGNMVWHGWGDADIAVILYNADHAFLTGMDSPEPGWMRLPQMNHLGQDWKQVSGEDKWIGTYYRQPLSNDITPQAFTVKIGSQYAASLTTWDWTREKLVQDIRADFPPIADTLFPFRLFINQLIGSRDHYMAMIAHESFHAFQGIVAEEKLIAAELTSPYEEGYPWDDVQADWNAEMEILQAAVRCADQTECSTFARDFLAARDLRRESHQMSDNDITLEQMREWEEGLAKYAELMIWQAASQRETYQPVPEMVNQDDFYHYNTFMKKWKQEVNQIGLSANQSSITRFYYSGMAQAVLLDRLLPDWKDMAMQDDVFLEDLLRQAVGMP